MTKAPTLEEWRRLYAAALRFRDAAPWRTVADDQNFGVRNPEDGVVAYCAILGNGREEFGLAIYPGAEGWMTLLRMQHDLLPENPDEMVDAIASLVCIFGSAPLRTEDRRIARRLGLELSGPLGWPSFTSYVPGYVPWSLTGAEARFLALTLEQALVVARRIAEEPTLLESAPERRSLVRVARRARTGLEWEDAWLLPPRERRSAAAWHPDQITSARMEKLPVGKHREWEVDCVATNAVIAEESGTRPRMVRTLIIADPASGQVLTATSIEAPQMDQELTRTFAEAALKIGSRPTRILVRGYRVRELIAPVAGTMGARVRKVSYLPALERAESALKEYLTRK